MAMEGRKGHQPWSPRIESSPLFITGAEYERGLGREDGAGELDLADEDAARPDDGLPETRIQPPGETDCKVD